jgi:hypothetical protein
VDVEEFAGLFTSLNQRIAALERAASTPTVHEHVTTTAWTAVTYANSWVDYGGGYQGVQYRKNGDNVEIRGAMKNGNSLTTCFTLPSGFRPPASSIFMVGGGGAQYSGLLSVGTDGAAFISLTSPGTNNSLIQINITFSTVS